MDFSIGLLVFVGAICVLYIMGKNGKAKKLREAQAAYKAALMELQAQNSSANRVKALELGRRYAELCREGGQVSMFDEVALQNDLKAYGGD